MVADAMAFFTLHYLLFGVVGILNLHLLAETSFQVIWLQHEAPSSAKQSTSSLNDGTWKFIYTQLAIFFISTLTFAIFSRTAPEVDRKGNHRGKLASALSLCVVLLAGLLYALNTIAYSNGWPLSNMTSILLRTIHSLVSILVLASLWWAIQVCRSIGDVLMLAKCVNHQPSRFVGIHHQLVSNLMLAASSLALVTLLQFDLRLLFKDSGEKEQKLINSNLLLALNLVALLAELLALHWLTKSGVEDTNDVQEHQEQVRRLDWILRRFRPERHQLSCKFEQGQKAIYSLTNQSNCLSASILTISGKQMRQQASCLQEITSVADDDEFRQDANTVELFYSVPVMQAIYYDQKKIKQQPTEPTKDFAARRRCFDSAKFSLYEGYEPKSLGSRASSPVATSWQYDASSYPTANRSNSWSKLASFGYEIDLTSQPEAIEEQEGCSTSSILHILLQVDHSFIQHLVLFMLIGASYQFNQLCFFTDYIYGVLLAPKSGARLPIDSLLTISGPFLPRQLDEQADLQQIRSVAAIELTCFGFLLQCLARLVCLNLINNIVIAWGRKLLLNSLALLSISLPIQLFISNQFQEFAASSQPVAGIEPRVLTCLSIASLVLLQLQVGVVGSAVDFLICDFTLLHAQQVTNFRSSRISERSDQPQNTYHCTIHGILSGSFHHLGAALMSTLLLAVWASCGSSAPLTWCLLALLPGALASTALLYLLCQVIKEILKRSRQHRKTVSESSCWKENKANVPSSTSYGSTN